MAIALVALAALAGFLVYYSDIVGLVLSLPDSNQDFVFTGESQGGKLAESARRWPIPPKELGTVPVGDSPRPAT